MAKAIDREVLRHCDAVLDFHCGSWGAAFGMLHCGSDYPDPDLVKRVLEMAVAFGGPIIHVSEVAGVFPGPRSVLAYSATKLGKPGVAVEVNGAGFGAELEGRWTAEGVTGIKNVMRYLGILDEPLEKPKRILKHTKGVRVNPSVGGLLVPEREPEELGREVKKGELLGRIISPYTFEELERLESPCRGWLRYMARSYPIRPGDWAFGVACAEGAEWITP
jgi:predicted deacylase